MWPLSHSTDPASQTHIPNLDGGKGHSEHIIFGTNLDLSKPPEGEEGQAGQGQEEEEGQAEQQGQEEEEREGEKGQKQGEQGEVEANTGSDADATDTQAKLWRNEDD